MKVSKIFVTISAIFIFCFSMLFVGCDNSEKPGDFEPSLATNLLDRLEVEDDSFINAINAKYEDTTSETNLQVLTKAIEEINTSVSSFIESYTDLKIMFSSSEYKEIFSYDANGFKYQEGSALVSVSLPQENKLKVETGDDESYCDIEVVSIKESNFAIRYFIKESGEDFGEEILCYFDGSVGRIAKRTCVLSQSNSIIALDDYSNFASDTGTGYYYFT